MLRSLQPKLRSGASPHPEGIRSSTRLDWSLWVTFAGLIGLSIGLLSYFRVVDLDLFHELAWFREVLETGELPLTDSFAYTTTISPIVHHEWGTGAVLYLWTVSLGTGATGLAVLRLLLLVGTATLVTLVARTRGASWPALLAGAPLAVIMFVPGLSPIRAHMFTFLLLAVLLALLQKVASADDNRQLLWLIPMFLLWINMHAGFVVGLGMLGLYTLERASRLAINEGVRKAWGVTRWHWMMIAASSFLILITPYGVDYPVYLLNAIIMDRPQIAEWAPIWQASFAPVALPVFIASLLAFGYSLLRTGERWQDPGALMVVIAAVFAADSIRFLPIYAVMWGAFVPAALTGSPLARLMAGWWERGGPIFTLVVATLGLTGFWKAAHQNPLTVTVPGTSGEIFYYPVGAVEYLNQTNFSGNLMTPFEVGAFVSWHLYPHVKVGMDSRYEVAYPPALSEEVMDVYAGRRDWRNLVERFPTDGILAPTGGALAANLRNARGQSKPRWEVVYRDDGYSVFLRRSMAKRQPYLNRSGQPIWGAFPYSCCREHQ